MKCHLETFFLHLKNKKENKFTMCELKKNVCLLKISQLNMFSYFFQSKKKKENNNEYNINETYFNKYDHSIEMSSFLYDFFLSHF